MKPLFSKIENTDIYTETTFNSPKGFALQDEMISTLQYFLANQDNSPEKQDGEIISKQEEYP